jgi:hypothetical protein
MRIPMKTVYKLTFAFLLVSQVASSQTRHFGNYFNKWRYWGPMFTLKEDSTFDYVIRTNAGTVTTTKPGEYGTITTTTDSYIFSDSSYGTFKLYKDTVFFSYLTKEVEGDFNGHNIRPTKLFWKGKSLYYINPLTGAVLRQKEYYMKWSKWKAPNLSRADETYSQRTKSD